MPDDYQIGIEEEYFVVDLRTRNVRATMPRKFYRTAKALLKDRLTSEMLQCQIEVTTSPCKSIGEARQELAQLRSALAEQAGRHGLGIMAASTHPIALWREQKQTPKERYSKVMSDIQMLGLRDMLCGMHVHVELPDPERRVEVTYRAFRFCRCCLRSAPRLRSGRGTGPGCWAIAWRPMTSCRAPACPSCFAPARSTTVTWTHWSPPG